MCLESIEQIPLVIRAIRYEVLGRDKPIKDNGIIDSIVYIIGISFVNTLISFQRALASSAFARSLQHYQLHYCSPRPLH
jgi:hypothetical protein